MKDMDAEHLPGKVPLLNDKQMMLNGCTKC